MSSFGNHLTCPLRGSATAIQFGCVALNPTPDGYVIHAEIPLCHDLLQLTEAKRIAQVPADAKRNDLGFEVPFEQLWPLPLHARHSLADRPIAVATHPS
jgi:hypothetical protein